jgi:hypothetical protein
LRKYWYLDLTEYLLELGFKPSKCVRRLFILVHADDAKIYVLNYVVDMLYFSTDAEAV